MMNRLTHGDAMEEKINHPEHYRFGTYEAIKVIEAWGLGFCLGNVVKYISRAGRKTGSSELEDLKKAAWYLNREIEKTEHRFAEEERQSNFRKTTGSTAADLEEVNRSYTAAVKEYQNLSRPKL
jgi:hypothetical protein